QPWNELLDALDVGLNTLRAGNSPAFRDVNQAEDVLALARSSLRAYRLHHADLLAHAPDADLFQPFFLARVIEAVLAVRAAEPDPPPESAVLTRLNDFVGYRPLPVLETRPRGEPYEHERIRPVPLYLRGVGIGWGRYQAIVHRAIEILAATDSDLLAEAQLDL